MARKRKAGEPVRIVVRIGDVPFDMLRYDRAVPDTETDAGKLERVSNGHGRPDDHLVTFACYAWAAPTTARWASFGAQVVEVLG